MKELKVITFFMMIITSCGTTKNSSEIFGKYKSKDGISEIILHKDNFYYTQKGSLYTSKSEGVWSLKDGRILLKSNKNFKDNMIEVNEINDTTQYIKVLDLYDKPISNVANVILTYENGTDSKPFFTDEKGIISIMPNQKIESIKIIYLDTFEYDVQNGNASYEVKVYPDNLDKKYFNNEQIRLNQRFIFLEGSKLYKVGDN